MDRRTFLAAASGAALATAAAGRPPRDMATLALLTAAADKQVAAALAAPRSPVTSPRADLRRARRLLTSFVWPASRHYRDRALLPPIDRLVAAVEAHQHDDGTFSAGNLHSPPDTAFLIEDMAVMVSLLRGEGDPTATALSRRLQDMTRRAGPALAVGGIHTPNHRWELSAALARIEAIDPRPAYRARIADWLAEGVDVDADGFYSERSPIYASEVTNPSLLILAEATGRSDLIAVVRRNLQATIDLAEPAGGEVESIHSRRQDQAQRPRTIAPYYLQYRALALRDGDARFAAIVRFIEGRGEAPGDALADLIESPALMRPLPAAAPTPFPDGTRLFPTVGLVRRRQGGITTSCYAGSDWYADGKPSPFYDRVGSGLATNPTLLRLWSGRTVIEAVRLIPAFFNLGHFRPATISLGGDGTVRMAGEMAVPYYQPLPAGARREDGAYPLTPSIDGRFFSALDFPRRPAVMRRLAITVDAVPQADGYVLDVAVTGEEQVDVTLELTLRAGGTLTGAKPLTDGSFHLVEGQAVYSVGDDRLTFGPGNGDGVVQTGAGDQYAWAGGGLNLPGTRVYVTGRSPLRYRMRIARG